MPQPIGYHCFRLRTSEQLMRVIVAIVVATGALLAAGYAVLNPSRLLAEQISGAETLRDPWNTSALPVECLIDAQTHFRARDYAGALGMLERVTSSNPDLGPAQVGMAMLYFQAGMVSETKRALKRAVVDAPDDPEAYALLGAIAMRQNELTEAKALFHTADRLLPTFNKSPKRKERLQPQIYNGLAMAAEAQSDWAGRNRPSKLC